MRKLRFACVFTALASVAILLLPNVADAQRYRGGGGGWNGGGWNGGGTRVNIGLGGLGVSTGRGGTSVWLGNGYGYGGYGYRGYGYGYPGYYNGGYYSSQPYIYSSPSVVYTAPTTTYQAFASPAPTFDTTKADLFVNVPTPDAQIWVDGVPMTQQGLQRHFQTASLQPGSDYTHEIRAHWNQNGQDMDRTQTVYFRAGQRVNVDFTRQ